MRKTRQEIIASSVKLSQLLSKSKQNVLCDDVPRNDVLCDDDARLRNDMDTIPHIPMFLMLTPAESTLMIELVLQQEIALHDCMIDRVRFSPTEIARQDSMKALCVKVRECLNSPPIAESTLEIAKYVQ
jgi:hypothetical protein